MNDQIDETFIISVYYFCHNDNDNHNNMLESYHSSHHDKNKKKKTKNTPCTERGWNREKETLSENSLERREKNA